MLAESGSKRPLLYFSSGSGDIENKENGTGIFNGYAYLYFGSRWIIINVKMEIQQSNIEAW